MNIDKLVTNNGRTIYIIPVQSFPELVTNLFLIDDGNQLILVDTGSAYNKSTASLVAGFAQLNEQFGQSFSLADIGAILVTHGHIDHYGGLNFLREHTDAPIGVHVLDRLVITHHEVELAIKRNQAKQFLLTADIPPHLINDLIISYTFGSKHYKSIPIDFLLAEDKPYANINFIHVPGHCAGMVCLQIDDIMLTADHVLSKITPHQSPESFTPNRGLGHYYDSLDKLARVPDVRLAVGSHDEPMPDMYGRIAEIKAFHDNRLEKTLAVCESPKTLREISEGLFGKQEGYVIIMALEETAAHVEYLHQRGHLVAANVAELLANENAPVRYIQHG